MSAPTSQITDPVRHRILTGLAYTTVAAFLILAWSWAELDLYRAQDGLGYWFGITGASLMVLLLLYPLRKRVKAMARWGPVRYWFRTHMIFGVLGPVLIILHSNFNLGSLNSRIALFCTIIVAASGIIGRYLYAKLHYGLYGRSATLMSLRHDINQMQSRNSTIGKLMPTVHSELDSWEDKVLAGQPGILTAFYNALTIEFSSRIKLWHVLAETRKIISQASTDSSVIAEHENRLRMNLTSHLKDRVTLVRKFAQFRAAERLFSLWHIVHYPLFLLLVLAAIVHILAVHMY